MSKNLIKKRIEQNIEKRKQLKIEQISETFNEAKQKIDLEILEKCAEDREVFPEKIPGVVFAKDLYVLDPKGAKSETCAVFEPSYKLLEKAAKKAKSKITKTNGKNQIVTPINLEFDNPVLVSRIASIGNRYYYEIETKNSKRFFVYSNRIDRSAVKYGMPIYFVYDRSKSTLLLSSEYYAKISMLAKTSNRRTKYDLNKFYHQDVSKRVYNFLYPKAVIKKDSKYYRIELAARSTRLSFFKNAGSWGENFINKKGHNIDFYRKIQQEFAQEFSGPGMSDIVISYITLSVEEFKSKPTLAPYFDGKIKKVNVDKKLLDECQNVQSNYYVKNKKLCPGEIFLSESAFPILDEVLDLLGNNVKIASS